MKRLKQSVCLLLTVLMLCSLFTISIHASDYTSGYWNYSVDSGKATITKYTGSATSVSIPSSLGGYTVTVIGRSAFSDNKSLQEISFGSYLKEIGSYAFSGCTGIKSITIPNSVTTIDSYAFSGCTRVATITIGSGLTEIPGCCFNECTSLETLKIGSNVTAIGVYAFSNCTALSSITWGSSLKKIESSTFYNCKSLTSLSIPNTVTIIESSAFGGCTGISSLSFGSGLKEIGSYAFSDCSGIKSITIPNSVTTIDSYAFSWCTRVTSITIGTGLTEISGCCFNECTSLETLKIGSNVTDIGVYAFNNCTALSSITWGSSLKKIGSCAFHNCKSLTSLSIPNTVTIIEGSAFGGCTGITSLTLGSKLKEIGSNAFEGCIGIKSVTIPSSVTSIDGYVFIGCTGLNKIYLYKDLQAIESYAFYDTGLKDVYYSGSQSDRKYLSISESGNSPIINATWHYNWNSTTDNTAPTVSISSTNNVAASQTATLSMSDNVGLAGYYWGTNSSYSSNTYTTVSGTSYSTNKTISSAGTYYLTAKDTSGNVSSTESKAFYKTTLNANSGSVSPSSVITMSGNSFALPTPTRSGYTCLGWATSSSATSANYSCGSSYKPTSNTTTLYAVWKPVQTYTVSYNANGGSGAPGNQTKIYGTDLTLSSTKPSKSFTITYNANGGSVSPGSKTVSCTFKNWNTKADGSGTSYNSGAKYTQNAAATLYAQWTNPTAGTLATPTKTGNTFDGWYTSSSGGSKVTDSTTVSANITVYAHWTSRPSGYTLSYNANGGSGAPGNQTGSTSYTISSTVPTRFAYTFLGWSTSSSASSASYVPGDKISLSKDTPLYAVWKAAAALPSGTVSVNVAFANQAWYYKITPSASGNYTFESTGSVDTHVYLYNASGSKLAENDDGGSSSNFKLTYSLNSGTTYYVVFRGHNSKTGSFSVNVTAPSAPVSDAKLEVKTKKIYLSTKWEAMGVAVFDITKNGTYSVDWASQDYNIAGVYTQLHEYSDGTNWFGIAARKAGKTTVTIKLYNQGKTQLLDTAVIDIIIVDTYYTEEIDLAYKQYHTFSWSDGYTPETMDIENESVIRLIDENKFECRTYGTGSTNVEFQDQYGNMRVVRVSVKYDFFDWIILILLFGWIWY